LNRIGYVEIVLYKGKDVLMTMTIWERLAEYWGLVSVVNIAAGFGRQLVWRVDEVS
jgi:hypothetical protein